MASLGLVKAFARYGAVLRNPQWSVSAWAPDGSLVVSIWDHHYRKGAPGSMEFADSADRWTGPGNRESRENVARAFAEQSPVRLVLVRTKYPERVQAGEDASQIPKEFLVREDLQGKVTESSGSKYAFRFTKS